MATVLAAYMAGLALGAAVAGRGIHLVRRPVLVYALLEFGIALTALAVPFAVSAASRLHVVLLGGSELPTQADSLSSVVFYLVSSLAILLVPTALMGATLPLLARHAIHRDEEIGRRIGALYTVNTAGAATGTLVAAFLLLPTLGLGRTVYVAAAVNLLVFVLAVILEAGEIPPNPPFSKGGTKALRASGSGKGPKGLAPQHWILPLILVSGAVAFTFEILWTRILTLLLGGSVYAFSTMLATFLAGIALGSAFASRLATNRERARQGFIVAQITAAALSIAAFTAVNQLPALVRPLTANDAGSTLGGIAVCALTLLPGAVAFGATFPFAVRVLVNDASDAASASARVFAWNTVGAIFGSLAAGFMVLPALRFAGTATAAAAASLALALVAALAPRPRLKIMTAISLSGLLLLTVVRPSIPWTLLRNGPITAREFQGEVVHYGVGQTGTILLFDQGNQWRLLSNGLPESGIQPPWERQGQFIITRWLSLLPLAARPETHSLLVVGLGAGVTVEDVPATVEEIHVVELEPEIVWANRKVASQRGRDPLTDPRLNLHIGDARGVLRLSGRHFDAIVSQPSHPWTAGASHLFTREFFTLARERLSPSGVFVQWMGLTFVDRELMRSLVATLSDVFPHVEVYQPRSGAVLLLASPSPLDIRATAPKALREARQEWAEVGVLVHEDILAARILGTEGARRLVRGPGKTGARISTDFHNLLRTRSPKILKNPLGAAGAEGLFGPLDPLATPTPTPEDLYIHRRLIRNGFATRATRLAQAFEDEVAHQTTIGLAHLNVGQRQRGEQALRRALSLDASSAEARGGLLRLYRQAIAAGQAFPLMGRLEEAEKPVIEGWQIAARNARGVRLLEERLTAIDPHHPLFMDAVRLRVRWRLQVGKTEDALEALALLEPILAPTPRPEDLLLRAEAAIIAEKSSVALASIREALPKLGRQSAAIGKARRLLRDLPVDAETRDWRQKLLTRLETKMTRGDSQR